MFILMSDEFDEDVQSCTLKIEGLAYMNDLASRYNGPQQKLVPSKILMSISPLDNLTSQ